ncbi:MAG: PQQ-binding-like beta-propeller repeat protein [Verrucomicrobia bacterium]|nr:PQQ-binding-like beta-propeller repeat protein [Verrucomicrobiota bacterium]
MILLCANCFAADWPGWRGPLRDGHVPPGVVVPETLPREPRIVWRLKIGDGLASPVVAGNKVFYLDNQENQEMLHALDQSTGRELWRSAIDDLHKDSQSAPGPRCTPLVDGDRIYAQSTKGELRCLNVTDGQVKWRLNFTRDFGAIFFGERGLAQGAHRHGYTGSPWVDNQRLLVTVGDTNGAGIACLDKQTGAVLWKSQNDRAGNAAPITALIGGVQPKQVVAFTVEGLIGLNLENGELLWRVPLSSTYGRHVTTPVVVGNVVIVASHQRGMIGAEITREAAAGNSTNAATSTKWNASIKWDSKDFTMNFSSPVAVGEYLYGLGPEKNLFCLEAKTGKSMWSREGYMKSSAEKAHAAFLAMGKNVLLLTDAGELVLFAANPSELKELGRVQVCGANWCNPAYADGKLFLRDARELLCVELLP